MIRDTLWFRTACGASAFFTGLLLGFLVFGWIQARTGLAQKPSALGGPLQFLKPIPSCTKLSPCEIRGDGPSLSASSPIGPWP